MQISSFQNWEEVGRWYWSLQKDRIEPTPAVRAKAAELTKGMTDDGAKLRALYSFVSTQYRYIGIAFGIGRYQPHAADDVLTNSYGDCKDKHTLLASLLQASGITLYPALINSSFRLDSDVPSPAQFDHVIEYLPQGKGKDAVWLDTTLEIAPLWLSSPAAARQTGIGYVGRQVDTVGDHARRSLFCQHSSLQNRWQAPRRRHVRSESRGHDSRRCRGRHARGFPPGAATAMERVGPADFLRTGLFGHRE